jgi:Icc protein
VVIISPSDERLLTKSSESLQRKLRVRAKIWAGDEIFGVSARLERRDVPMQRVANSQIWEAVVDTTALEDGIHALAVEAEVEGRKTAADEIQIVIGDLAGRMRAVSDQGNALEAWPEHGLLGTQLGPNKNGKK